MRALILFSFLVVSACATTPPMRTDTQDVISPIGTNEYEKIIEKYSGHDKQYSGFYASYEAHLTLITSEVAEASLRRMAYYMLWGADKVRSEREKFYQENSTQSKVVLSLFTPERGHNDLDKANSMWKIYLEVEGKKYPGEAKKPKQQLVQQITLYPYHNRFSKLYEITFPVPMSIVEKSPVKVILTSSLGTTIVQLQK